MIVNKNKENCHQLIATQWTHLDNERKDSKESGPAQTILYQQSNILSRPQNIHLILVSREFPAREELLLISKSIIESKKETFCSLNFH